MLGSDVDPRSVPGSTTPRGVSGPCLPAKSVRSIAGSTTPRGVSGPGLPAKSVRSITGSTTPRGVSGPCLPADVVDSDDESEVACVGDHALQLACADVVNGAVEPEVADVFGSFALELESADVVMAPMS